MKRASLLMSLIVTGACSMKMQAQSSAGSSPASAAEAPESQQPKEKKPHGGGKSFSASFHESASIKIDWQGRSGRLCRASTPFKFVGTAKLAGTAQLTPSGVKTSGHAEGSGKTSGGAASDGDCSAPRTPVPPAPPAPPAPAEPASKPEPTKPKPTKPDKDAVAPKPPKPPKSEPEPAKPTKPDKEAVAPKPAKPPKPDKPAKPVGPSPEELEKPVEPPAKPSDNVFGYEKPVLGCFEGQVFPLAPETQKLPTNYAKLTPVSVLYACEWNIPPRAWEQGFPGVDERFEWFAIRYAGAFRIASAGDYTFRVSSDDGTKLTIDGKTIIDNDGQHPPKEATGKVHLTAADHQMVLEYFQGPRYQINLQLWITPPGKPEELFTVR